MTGMPTPPVSVVIPAFNAAAFLPDTVGSVLDQSREGVEVIVVDDGSTDETPDVLAGFGPSIRQVRQDNAGVAAARNEGLRLCRSPYVCFMDADDWMHPDNLRVKVEHLDAHPADVMVQGLVEPTDAQLRPTGPVLRGARGHIGEALAEYIPSAVPCPSSVVVRTTAVRDVGGFDTRLSTSADFDLWLRLAAMGSVGRIDEPLVRYRRHEGAMFHNVELQLHDRRIIFGKYPDGPLPGLLWNRHKARFYLSAGKALVRQGRPLESVPVLLRWLWHGLASRRRCTGPPG